MNVPVAVTTAGTLAYMAGSIPFGYLVGRVVLKHDIRDHGSGNIGATNVARVIGKQWGLAVLVADCLKGALPTLLIPPQLADDQTARVGLAVLCGIATVVGHMFPIWLKLKGGKGVATGLGVALVLSWQSTVAALVVFIAAFATTRRTSVGSMLAAVTFGVTYFVLTGREAFAAGKWPLSAFAVAVPTLIIFQHRTNIARLLKGEEPSFSDRAKQPEDTETTADEAPSSTDVNDDQ